MSSNKNWMDQIFEEFEQAGGLQDLTGKGKPIPEQALQGDVFQSILKNANYVPTWVEQQQLICNLLLKSVQSHDAGHLDTCEALIATINDEIRKYNRSCPPIMQRGLVSIDTLRDKLALWQSK